MSLNGDGKSQTANEMVPPPVGAGRGKRRNRIERAKYDAEGDYINGRRIWHFALTSVSPHQSRGVRGDRVLGGLGIAIRVSSRRDRSGAVMQVMRTSNNKHTRSEPPFDSTSRRWVTTVRYIPCYAADSPYLLYCERTYPTCRS